VTDYFFTTSATANENLKAAGIPDAAIYFVGNTMIDTLLKHHNRFCKPDIWDELDLTAGQYLVLTLHRPATVDTPKKLGALITAIIDASQGRQVIFPIHPRTASVYQQLNIQASNLHVTEPLPYLQFNYLVKHAQAVVTDSGGITEEATVMHVPCMTIRDNTERPETCTIGSNKLLGTNPAAIAPAFDLLFSGQWQKGDVPPLWDGKTAQRIITILKKIATSKSTIKADGNVGLAL
jgi:UDP-N-acetylglucosamine 2-epimerase (non-hydrolysing)